MPVDDTKIKEPISFEDVMEFIESRIGTLNCPDCRNSGWAVQVDSNPGQRELGLVKVEWASMLPTGHYEAIPFACEYCGHIKLFSGYLIRKWKLDGKPRRYRAEDIEK